MLKSLENSRGFLLVVLCSALLLLVLLATDLEHGLPSFNEVSAGSPGSFSAPVDDFPALMDLTDERTLLTNAESQRVFRTRFFDPAPKPKEEPAPPAPTTREVALTYLGMFETSEGERRAFVRRDDSTQVLRVTEEVEPGYEVASISATELGVSGAETNLVLRFREPFQLRLPIEP